MIGPMKAGDPATRPVDFAFSAPASGQVDIVWAGIAGAGGGVRVSFDGKEAFHQTWPALPDLKASEMWRRQPAPPPTVLPYQAGPHTITIEGLGPAWVQIDHLSVPDLGRNIRANAIGDGDLALVRVQADEGAVPATVDLRVAGLADGPCRRWSRWTWTPERFASGPRRSPAACFGTLISPPATPPWLSCGRRGGQVVPRV